MLGNEVASLPVILIVFDMFSPPQLRVSLKDTIQRARIASLIWTSENSAKPLRPLLHHASSDGD
jgi:hypothetical protein